MTRGIVLRLMLTLILSLGLATVASADKSDFALFDGTNPLNQPSPGAVCFAIGAFTYHVAVANWGSAGFVRITYKDGDIIRFPIAPGASFTFSQAGGNRGGADAAVRVSNEGSAAQLAGAMSASNASGDGRVRCISCDGVTGDAECDLKVPN